MSRVERTSCPLCANSGRTVGRLKTIDPAVHEEVELRECPACGHWWHTPVPDDDDLVRMYATAHPAVVESGARESYAAGRRVDYFQTRVLHATSDAPVAQYLEIGSGGGHLLARLRERGNICFGVDPGQWIEDSSIVPTLEDVPAQIAFDAFILQDVLEHVFDPVSMLTALRLRAAPGARVYASFPWNESRQARRYREGWTMVRPFGHLHYFSIPSATAMMRQAGWSVVETKVARTTPLRWLIRRLNIRSVAYEILKGGRDQLHVVAVAA